ncbi:MAG: hypothetical protein IKN57_04060, partial [Parasporobacterium sp.]|nr:hypothetical protein [Parasporobacterium sp.]
MRDRTENNSNDKTRQIYCRLIWKKGILILPRFLLTLLVTLAALALATFLIIMIQQKRQSLLPKIQVGVVVLDGDMATTMMVRVIGEMDAVKNVCDLRVLSKTEAERAVKSGELQAAIYLTEDIYHDFSGG